MTDFGNSAVLTVITLATTFYLFACKSYRAALSLLLAFIMAASGIGIAKLIFLGCVHGTVPDINSPSGHTALSVAVYVMLAVLFASQIKSSLRVIPYIAASSLVSLIAISRVILKYHTVEEVLTGLLIGSASVLIACAFVFFKRPQIARFNIYVLLLIVAALAFALYKIELPVETLIRSIAAQLKLYIPACGEF